MARQILRLLASGVIACILAVSPATSLFGQQFRGRAQDRTSQTHSRSIANGGQRRHSQSAASRQSQRSVRPASAQFTDSYEQTLAPSAMGELDVVHEESILIDQSGVEYGPAYSNAGLGCESCGMASSCCCNPAGFLLDWSRADLWMGVTGFTGPANFLTTDTNGSGQVEGSFGFQQGFNFGSRLPSLLGGQVGSQIGMRFTQTQLDGTSAGDDNRTQTFITAGLFRRVDYGLQGGLVVDYLHDDWVYQADLVQLRGELSFLFSPCHDFGFRFTDSQQVDDTQAVLRGSSTPLAIRLAGLNNYRFFYRYRFGERARGLAELQTGFTEESNAVLGISLKTPLQNQLGLETNATYLMPPSDSSIPYTQEGWNVGVAIVWTPGRVFGTERDYYRPLLDVASNGSFLARLTRMQP